MKQIEVSELTVEKIKNRKLEKLIPELYELEKVIENNRWHNNESALSHIFSVLTELRKVLKRLNKKNKLYLNKKINIHSRKELLFLAALFHDIGKKETYRKAKGVTQCRKHERISAGKFKAISPRFGLPDKEIRFVIELVKNHNLIHGMLDKPGKNLGKRIEKLKEEYSNILLEIILLSMADMLGSQLKDNNPKEFKFRIGFLNKILTRINDCIPKFTKS